MVITACIPVANATHIVGGEMTYTCLGDDLYEIQLVVYRDCFFGNPNAYFDDPASIGVFDQNNELILDIRVDLMGDDTLSQVLTDECLVVPPSVCVHTTTYRTTVELPPIIGGYQLAYQRCCRNQTIANIIEPLATGATFGVLITERALLECNSSAQFLEWPPLYICANEPIFFDQSATDMDGDSIVYRLCTPLQGADQDIPRPQPPNNPPYAEVNWNDPPYGTDNMLNGIPGGQVLSIDPVTGLLTGIPNTIGQFVVGICAEEYRDGELISTTRRDFQYNVGVCGQVTAAFFVPEIQCDGLEVVFDNQSLGANDYLWVFGDIENPLGTSLDPSPSFVFPDTGLYTISLIAEPDEFCADTFSQEIYLLPNSLMPAFEMDTIACGDSLWLQLTDLSIDTFSSPQAWEWSVNEIVFSNEMNPALILTEPGTYQIDLLVTAENGCQQLSSFEIDGLAFIDEELASDTILLCPGDSVYLNTTFNSSYTYSWSPNLYLNDATSPNPLASPPVSIAYALLITDTINGCTAERNIQIEVDDPLVVDLTEDLTTCSDSILLEAMSNNGIRYFWASDPDFTMDIGVDSVYWVSPIGQHTYFVQVINQAGCIVVDSVTINSQAVNIHLPVLDTVVCLGDPLELSIEELDPDDVLLIEWLPSELITNGQNTTEVEIATNVIGEQEIIIQASNQYGCVELDSVLLTVVDTIQSNADLTYLQCNGNRVQFSSTHPYASLYEWHFADPFAPAAHAIGAEVSHTYFQAGSYEVFLTLPEYLDCWDTLRLPITVLEQGSIVTDYSWEYQTCADTALIVFTDETQVSGTTIVAWEWSIMDNLISNENTADWTVYANETQNLQLITTAENGCIDTLVDQVNIPLISFSLVDSLQICPNETVFLYPGANEDYAYEWSPAATLDDALSPNPQASPQEDIIYMVEITDPNSICQREGTITVQVPEMIDYSLSPDTTLCDEEVLMFVQSDQDLQYEWASSVAFSSIINENEEWLANINGEDTYYIRITDTYGCERIDSILVNSQFIHLSIDEEQTICFGDTLTLNAIATGGEGLAYHWTSETEIIGSNMNSSILVSPQESTDYQLSITNDFGCEIDTTIHVNIFNFRPPLSVIPEIDTLIPGESIQLLATDRPGYTYVWSPNVGLSEIDVFNPIASPEETTTYQLMIRDANGCTNTAEILLIVFNSPCQRPYVFTPNAFTPNGDHLNDDWGVEGNVIESIHLMVYDRWGELVFESFDQDDRWDGTYNEKLLTADVYGYVLEVECIRGESFIEKGNVSLIR